MNLARCLAFIAVLLSSLYKVILANDIDYSIVS